MWPTDFYRPDQPIEKWKKSMVIPDDEFEYLDDLIPEIGMEFKSDGKTFRVIGIRRWNSRMFTGWVKEITQEIVDDERRKREIKETFGKNPDIEFPECEKIDGEQLALF